jgi:hypothetical protein
MAHFGRISTPFDVCVKDGVIQYYKHVSDLKSVMDTQDDCDVPELESVTETRDDWDCPELVSTDDEEEEEEEGDDDED